MAWKTMTDAAKNEWIHAHVANSTGEIANYVGDLNAIRALELRLPDPIAYITALSHHVSRVVYAGKTEAQIASGATVSEFYFTLATLSADDRCRVLFLLSISGDED